MAADPDRHHADRSPRRWTDRVEAVAAWTLTAAALLVLLSAVVCGVRVAGDALDRSRLLDRERVEVQAQILDDLSVPYRPSDASVTVRSVRYVDPGGREHLTDVAVAGRPPAGAAVQLWIGRTGEIVQAPTTPLDAALLGLASGLGIATMGASVIAVVWIALRRVLDARNRAAWAREWRQVEPLWSGREHRL